MARSRNIKPGFFKNEVLAELDPMVRLLCIGLWTLADREGRLEDRPARIKAEIFPYEKFNADEGLETLATARFILRYMVGGCKYIQIFNFLKHQSPHVNEQASTIPAPDMHQTASVPVALIPSSLIPSSLIPESIMPEFSAVDRFEAIWKKYPNKDGKRDALRHFKATVKCEEDWENIQKALGNYLASERVKKGFIKNGSTWFNGWRDWVDYTETGGPPPEDPAARIKRLEALAAQQRARRA